MSTPTKAIRYEPRGASLDFFSCKDPEVLIEGPAGTGKSAGILQKYHLLALKYADCRILFLRKTRVSIRQSLQVTWERFIHPEINGAKYHRDDSEYRYPNGSIVALGGLDKTSKIMSTDWDCIFIQEATEITLNDLEEVSTRCRNGVIPYQQLVMDANPSYERHWLNQRAMPGMATRRLKSEHTDNPKLWDGHNWTPMGAAYIARLQALSGVRRKRLYEGVWASAEGMVYDEWEDARHIIPFNEDWTTNFGNWEAFWAVDFGFTNPFVAQLWVIEPETDVMMMALEIYMTGRLVEDHARAMLKLQNKWRFYPQVVVCDHDAEGRATIERHLKIRTEPAYKKIREGVQAVQARMRVDPRIGRPKILFMRDALQEVDIALTDVEIGKSLPNCTVQEVDGYVWDLSNNRKKGEEPVDKDNHGMDTMRYAVAYHDHLVDEEDPGDILAFGSVRGWTSR